MQYFSKVKILINDFFENIKEKIPHKIKIMLSKNKLGYCKNCKKAFLMIKDKCVCQDFLCFRCCECELDCDLCNCKLRTKGR